MAWGMEAGIGRNQRRVKQPAVQRKIKIGDIRKPGIKVVEPPTKQKRINITNPPSRFGVFGIFAKPPRYKTRLGSFGFHDTRPTLQARKLRFVGRGSKQGGQSGAGAAGMQNQAGQAKNASQSKAKQKGSREALQDNRLGGASQVNRCYPLTCQTGDE